ncbi:Ctf3p LALA0_S01e10726g [Lachancea lanzarotensis]|uniref:LALA0S01e10726g1_1 n=1 Tax=Lachancea lanzarotensis TaxID=1245769 RepID=A0A0C7N4M6_9SACH|nr:uncharacterized protein LALA0_S01e10726g [Lachancea lanzarotensis]CEP60431.1 LALA0S01e10726g1_1 [Lachancea lanzarotensis]
MGIADDCFRVLIDNKSLRTDQIHELLTKIKTHVIKEGISTLNLDAIIGFLCETLSISISTKILLIKDALLPNGKVPRSTIYAILRRLGVRSLSTPNKSETPRALQTELCQWLVHVYIYMQDVTVFEDTYSHWLQLWQLDYLQQWITYLLFWSTTKPLVKPWRMQLITKIADNTGYSNAKACATLLLEKFHCLVPNRQINDAIEHLNCNKRRLNTLKRQVWDLEFMSKWASIVEHSHGVSQSTLQNLVQELDNQLANCSQQDIPSIKRKSLTKIAVHNIGTLERLAASFELLTLPNDLEELFRNSDESSLVFLATLDPHHKFWSRVSEWTRLKFYTASIHANMVSYRQSIIRPLLVAELLNPQPSTLQHISNISWIDDLREFMLHKTGTPELDSLEKLKGLRLAPNFETGHFYNRCRTLLYRIHVLNKRRQINPEIFRLLKFIISCIAEHSSKHIGNRHLTTTSRLLVIVLCELACYDNDKRFFEICLLPQAALDSMMISSDPVVLNTVCSYLSSKSVMKGLCDEKSIAEARNKSILDLINYLWRNKLGHGLPTFKIPEDFIRRILEVPGSDLPNAELELMFGILNIPALAFPARVALEGLEDALTSRVHFNQRLSEKSYSDFTQAHPGDWLDTISSFHELKLAILGKLRHHDAYGGIAKFLYIYLHDITDSGSS